MTTVQLGWLQDIIDWIFDKILSPVFEWLGGLLSDVFNWLFNILKPVLDFIFEIFLKDIIGEFLEFVAFFVYKRLTIHLMILDCLEDSFNAISGLKPVYFTPVKGGATQTTSLISAVYSHESVQRIIGLMIAVGLGLCFLCAILATIKSIFEMDGSENKSIGHVMRQTAKAYLYFILIPFMSMIFLYLSTAILNSLNLALSGGFPSSVARTIFTISTMDAVDTDRFPELANYNSSYEGQPASDFGLTDRLRRRFYERHVNSLGEDIEQIPAYAVGKYVKEHFLYRKLDYVVGFVITWIMVVVMCSVLFVFICRVFDVMLLLAVQPFFVAVMPLDDGEHYRKWTEMFVGKLFGGFGLVAAMRVYLTIAGTLFTNEIYLVDPNRIGGVFINYIMKLFFLVAGSIAIKSSGPLITSILSEGAAQGEQEQIAVGEMVGKKIQGAMTKPFKKGLQAGIGKLTGMMGGG
ncbi:MAG: hypothetical protein J6P05_03615, partial [Lachnospiraceae bacterium]|nr:hypothetical protein [Lachnospiraceae bacterium]